MNLKKTASIISSLSLVFIQSSKAFSLGNLLLFKPSSYLTNKMCMRRKPINVPKISIKLTCAGSRCVSPRKAMKNLNGETEISSDYLKPELRDSRFTDLCNSSLILKIDSNLKSLWTEMSNSSENSPRDLSKYNMDLEKNDLFFEIKKDERGNSKLKFIRPGVGSEHFFDSDSSINETTQVPSYFQSIASFATKSGVASPGVLNVGKYDITNSANVLSKTILSLIDFIDQSIDSNCVVNFELDGHSRGAVATGRALDYVIEKLNSENYLNKLKNKKINFNCVLYDPVAGPDGGTQQLNLKSTNPSVSLKLTQVISTDTGAPGRFLQYAFSSSAHIPTDACDSTVVFLPIGHSVGNLNMCLVDGKLRKTAWKYNDIILNFGQIGQLPPGVYFPETLFYVENGSNGLFDGPSGDKVRLTKDWRIIVAPDGSSNTQPIELIRVNNCDSKTLSKLQENLLLDNNWVKNHNRKDIFLKLLNSSLHINKILDVDKKIEFDSNLKLCVSEIDKSLT